MVLAELEYRHEINRHLKKAYNCSIEDFPQNFIQEQFRKKVPYYVTVKELIKRFFK